MVLINKYLLIFLLLASPVVIAQDMRQNAYYSLFSDQKANRVGDAVTILVIESSQASNNAETSAGRTSRVGLDADGGFNMDTGTDPTSISGSGGFDLGTNNDFKGSGSTKATGMVRTKISATVDSVLANGNMIIKGSRKIVINGEEQTLFIKGVVRPSDIAADNSIYSYSISDAEIIFEGGGMINDSQKPGWLTKFLHWIF